MQPPKPDWLKIRYSSSPTLEAIKKDVRLQGLATVCQESLCPNVSECWTTGTATFMLLGDTCTRGCAFCHVKTSSAPGAPDPLEGAKLVASIQRMKLTYVVLTTVDRDDLPDQGAVHLAAAIRLIKLRLPSVRIEMLTGDFQGDDALLGQLIEAGPDVLAHNVETVGRLTSRVRDRRASYQQSLRVLSTAKMLSPSVYTKSSLMVGLGEREEEMLAAMDDLRSAGVDFLTIGQYLQPSQKQLTVRSYLPLQTFKYYEEEAYARGFRYVASGPYVRSSYKAGELFITSVLEKRGT